MAAQPAEDVAAFQERLGVDDRAFTALLELQPEAQRVVMFMVEQRPCNNASAVTWSRIKAFRENPIGRKAEYVRSLLDEKVSGALRELPLPVQDGLLAEVDMLRSRNPSAQVWSKIKGSCFAGGARGRSRSPAPMASGHFAHHQAQALAAVIGRLGGPRYGGPPVWGGPPAWGGPPQYGGLPVGGGFPEFAMQGGLDDRAQKALAELSPSDAHIVKSLVGQQACKNPSAVCWTKVKQMREMPDALRREFLLKNIDEGAGAALAELPEDAQQFLVGSIDVSTVRNLSAVVWSRIKSAKADSGQVVPHRRQPTQPRFPPHEASFPTYDSAHSGLSLPPGVDLDHRCVAGLQKLSPEKQAEILSQVNPETVRNPSAFVWSKVRAALQEAGL